MGLTPLHKEADNDLIRHLSESQKMRIEAWTFSCTVDDHPDFRTLVFDGDFGKAECPLCRKERQKEEERRRSEEEFFSDLIKNNGVPADNARATFETFEIRRDEGEQVAFEDSLALNAVKSILNTATSKDPYSKIRNVTICGKTGFGKSFLASALASGAKKEGISVFMIKDSSLLSMVLACGKGKGSEADQLRRRFESYQILIVDDWDPERWHQAKCTFMADLILTLNGDLKQLLLLTNRTRDEAIPAFGSAVESRLKRGRVIVWIHGEDRRKRQKIQEAV